MRARRVRRDERGAVLALAALAMVAILTITALAIDLGQGRFAKRSNQSAVDLAAVAAGYHLAGSSADPIAVSPQKACDAAILSIQTNLEGFTPALSAAERATACNGYPATDAGCPALPVNPDVEVVRGRFRLVVSYPVPASEIVEPRFQGGVGINDGTEQCSRMRIRIERTDETRFAGIIGVDEVATSAESVVIGDTDSERQGTPAFLMLERVDCGVLSNSVGGASQGIVVNWNGDFSDPQPGLIHVDSFGTGSCSGSTTDAYAVWASTLPSGNPSITIEGSPYIAGPPEFLAAGGLLTVSASVASGRAAATFSPGGGLSVPGYEQQAPVSRKPVDDKYNSLLGNDPDNAIHHMHADALAAVTQAFPSAAAVAIPGEGMINCNGNPVLPTTAATLLLATKLWVDCGNFDGFPVNPTVFGSTNAAMPNVRTVVFRNDVTLDNGDILRFTRPIAVGNQGGMRVVVRGKFDVKAGHLRAPGVSELFVAEEVSTDQTGTFALNTEQTAATGSSCPALPPLPGNIPLNPGYQQNRNVRFVIFDNGNVLKNQGATVMCETTLMLAGPLSGANSTYAPQQRTNGNPHPSCTTSKPCPNTGGSNVVDDPRFEFSSTVWWKAPNNYSGPVPDTDPQGLEDLALWTESRGTLQVKSGGAATITGVSFAPNAAVEMRSPATAAPINAQFIARKLFLFQGTLAMRPVTSDVVEIPLIGSFNIIR